jgi:DNA-binding Lrp family transcriptional regulator
MVGLEALRKSDLFEGLSDDELAAIAKMAREETYDVGVVIFYENDPAKNVYIVREGRVAILIDIGRGKQTVIDTICRNGSFGWSAMVPPYILTGAYDMMIEAVLPSGEHLLSFLIDKVSTIPGIKRTETSHVMQVVKQACDWAVPELTTEPASSGRRATPPSTQVMPGAIVVS